MGNKASRRKANAGVNSSKADGAATGIEARPAVQSASADASDDQKGVSSPDLAAGAVPYSEDGAETAPAPRHVSFTIYRSHSNIAEASRRPEPRPDIRYSSSQSHRLYKSQCWTNLCCDIPLRRLCDVIFSADAVGQNLRFF